MSYKSISVFCKLIAVTFLLFCFSNSASACTSSSETIFPVGALHAQTKVVHFLNSGVGFNCILTVYATVNSNATTPYPIADSTFAAKNFGPGDLVAQLHYYPGTSFGQVTHCLEADYTVSIFVFESGIETIGWVANTLCFLPW